jgi:16S rRNA (cytosine1402-N4)-methyltransferase
MRFDESSDFTAYDVVNDYSEQELVRIFSEYGEERFSKRIAKAITEQRRLSPIKTTTELAELIVNSTPRVKSNIHPATRVFQAVRIEVNNELQNVKNTLNDVLDLLDFGAIISVISFHSLEDRVVKQVFKYHSTRCHCEPNQMICNCPPPILEIVNKKPIMATEQEISENPPSRSAKLRIARCIRK